MAVACAAHGGYVCSAWRLRVQRMAALVRVLIERGGERSARCAGAGLQCAGTACCPAVCGTAAACTMCFLRERAAPTQYGCGLKQVSLPLSIACGLKNLVVLNKSLAHCRNSTTTLTSTGVSETALKQVSLPLSIARGLNNLAVSNKSLAHCRNSTTTLTSTGVSKTALKQVSLPLSIARGLNNLAVSNKNLAHCRNSNTTLTSTGVSKNG
jgi:hypothetical protein